MKKFFFNSFFLSFIFIGISLLIFFYVLIRTGFSFHGNYLKYYIISILIIFSSFLSLFLQIETKIRILLLSISFILGLYICEGYLYYKDFNNVKKENIKAQKQIKITNIEFDHRDKIEVFNDLKKKGENPSVTIGSHHFIKNDLKEKLIPFSGISKRKTINCNENGYFSSYHSDRYGFNNPDKEWDKKNIDFVLIGDSFTLGSCVNEANTIAGIIRKKIGASVINLGYNRNGPLVEYATLREYIPYINTNKILWIYYEGNDLGGLNYELRNGILSNYLKDSKFTQNLFFKQKIIDLLIEKELQKKMKEKSKTKNNNIVMKIINFLDLKKLRLVTFEKFFNRYPNEFIKIIKLVDELAKNKNAQLYFIYLPDIYRNYNKKNFSENYMNYKDIINIINELEIPIIDIHKDVFMKHADPLSLFPFRSRINHYNERGYNFVTDTIIYKINELEKIKNN